MRLFACLSIYVAVAASLYTGRFSHGNEVSGPEFQSKLIQPILSTRNVSLSNGTHFLFKRGDPNFDEEWWSNDPKKRALEAALIDTRTLVSRVVNRWDEPFAIEIRKRYFPDADANAVKQVFSNIVRQPNPSPGQFTSRIEEFTIYPDDFDFDCSKPGSGDTSITYAYMKNYDEDGDIWGLCHFCPQAFDPEEKAQRLHDRVCENFKDPATDTYHLHWKMMSLGSLILHELTHFMLVGEPVGYPPNDQEPDEGWGEPKLYIYDYFTGISRIVGAIRRKPTACKHNADSYAWYANEVYWTVQCNSVLSRPDAGTENGLRCLNFFAKPNSVTTGDFGAPDNDPA